MKLDKLTNSERRRYDDACAAAHALDLIGERWALLVVRELMFGPKRFGDLRASLPGISANVLTQRLEGLIESGIAVRRRLPPPVSAQVYALTEWGLAAEPIFQALGRWAEGSPGHDPTRPFSAASAMLSLRTMIDHERSAGLAMTIGFRFGAETFTGRLADRRLDIVAGASDDADVVFEGTPSALAASFYGGVALAESGLRVTGNASLAQRFIELFAR